MPFFIIIDLKGLFPESSTVPKYSPEGKQFLLCKTQIQSPPKVSSQQGQLSLRSKNVHDITDPNLRFCFSGIFI